MIHYTNAFPTNLSNLSLSYFNWCLAKKCYIISKISNLSAFHLSRELEYCMVGMRNMKTFL